MSIESVYHTRIIGTPVTEIFGWPYHRAPIVRHRLPFVYDNHLLPNYCDKRLKLWKRRYTWDTESLYVPSYFSSHRPTQSYFTYWSS